MTVAEPTAKTVVASNDVVMVNESPTSIACENPYCEDETVVAPDGTVPCTSDREPWRERTTPNRARGQTRSNSLLPRCSKSRISGCKFWGAPKTVMGCVCVRRSNPENELLNSS